MNKFSTTTNFFLIFCLITSPLIAQKSLYINEIMASNANGITDESNKHEDWFEIYNSGDQPVDIANYYLTDNASNHKKFQVPANSSAQTTIPAKGFLIIWASSAVSRGPLHTSFSLSASGEFVGIYSPDDQVIDEKAFGPQKEDISFGRKADGGQDWAYFSVSSPRAGNATGTVQLIKLAVPVFSHAAGFQTTNFALSITSADNDPTVKIWYTTDGSEPVDNAAATSWSYKNRYNENGTSSQQQVAKGVDDGLSSDVFASVAYTIPIPIADRKNEPNRVSVKTSSIAFDPTYLPLIPIYKGTVIKAKAFKEGFLPSETVTKTYFINASGTKYPVPVISVSTNERSLFSYTDGLYTPGRRFDLYRQGNPNVAAWSCTEGNFSGDGDLWERRGTVEFFDNGNTLNQDIAFRIHGGCTRSLPEKTLRLYSDTDFNFNVFPEKPTLFPKRLLLRNSGNDNGSTMFRDAFYQTVVRNLSFDTQLSRPSVVFLNSEYWGIHTITERYDRFYLAKKYGVDKDNVDLISIEDSEVEEGDNVKFNELITFVNNNPLSNTVNYNNLKNLVDIDNFTDYEIAEIFCGNVDWPQKNSRLWRTKVPNTAVDAPYGQDGKWRWMLFDTDLSLGSGFSVSHNYFPEATDAQRSILATLFKKLLENSEYRRYFLARLADLLNTTFLSSRSTSILANVKAQYEPLMPEHIARWKSPATFEIWNSNVTSIQNFVTNRPAFYRDNVRTQFGSSYQNLNLTVNVSDPNLGYVKVNSINIVPTTDGISANPYPWTGIYFQNVPLKLTAIAKSGSRFLRWEDSNGIVSTNPEVNITPGNSTLSYKAFYEESALPVVLSYFEARKDNRNIMIQWKTTYEKNNDFFEVERSGDARGWTVIAKIDGSDSSNISKKYQTIDKQPSEGVNYYRLRQVDRDRTTTYSRIVSVDMGKIGIDNLWPNPVVDFLHVKIDSSKEAEFEITDINGMSVTKFRKMSANNAVIIPVGNLATGIYILKIKDQNGSRVSSKFIKQ